MLNKPVTTTERSLFYKGGVHFPLGQESIHNLNSLWKKTKKKTKKKTVWQIYTMARYETNGVQFPIEPDLVFVYVIIMC